MTSGYYCAIFPFRGGGKKKNDDKKKKAFYDWATTGIPVKKNRIISEDLGIKGRINSKDLGIKG